MGKDISDGIEMPDYDEKSPPETITEFLAPYRKSPPPFDFERLTRFMAYGFIMSPVQFQWFAFLTRSFPITKESATLPAMKRVCFDQLIFAPIGSAILYMQNVRWLMSNRISMLFHFHDRHRRRWKTGSDSQGPGCLPSSTKGQFHALACSADA